MSSLPKQHLPCEKCGSSDAFTDYGTHGHCFSCGYHPWANNSEEKEEQSIIELNPTKSRGSVQRDVTPLPDNFSPLADRGISRMAAERFRIAVNHDKSIDVAHRYPYFKNGVHVANKVRRASEKAFWWEGDKNEFNTAELFGQSSFPAGSAKAITLVEGECDAAAAFELMGSRYPVVSVLGADSAVRDVRNNYEYLDSFEEIVINFDADDAKINPNTGEKRYPGQEAAKKVAGLFKPGKVRILTLRNGKDANDYLRKGLAGQYTKEWWGAPKFMPDGLRMGPDMWDDIINQSTPESISYPFERINKMTYGIRLSEVVLVKADTGVGKTSLFKEIEHHILMDKEAKEKEYGIGFLHLEETNRDTALGLMSIHNNKPYHLPDTERTVDELKKAYDAVVNTNRVVIWDHFGSNSIDAVLDKVRHMAALGCRYIFLDHLSIVVSDQSGDERKQLDEISTKLKTLCMELNIAVICVIHTNRQGQVRSSAGPEKVANIMMDLSRDKLDPDPWRRNVVKITIEKNRFAGRTGPCEWLSYNELTGRMQPLTQEEIDTYESGGNIRDDERAF